MEFHVGGRPNTLMNVCNYNSQTRSNFAEYTLSRIYIYILCAPPRQRVPYTIVPPTLSKAPQPTRQQSYRRRCLYVYVLGAAYITRGPVPRVTGYNPESSGIQTSETTSSLSYRDETPSRGIKIISPDIRRNNVKCIPAPTNSKYN